MELAQPYSQYWGLYRRYVKGKDELTWIITRQNSHDMAQLVSHEKHEKEPSHLLVSAYSFRQAD